MATKTQEQQIIDLVDAAIARDLAVVARYTARMAEDPTAALSNCDDLIAAAAALGVNRSVRAALTKDGTKATASTIAGHVRREALQCVRFPTRSTSVTFNMAAQAAGAAWAALVDALDSVFPAIAWKGR